MKFKKGLFVFRRDFRITDNRGLYRANEVCESIVPIFIFTPEQVGKGNHYKSNNAIQFMIDSLSDLQQQIHKQKGELLCLYGENTTVVADLIHSLSIDYVAFNKDYSPYAVERDDKLVELCKKRGVVCEMVEDYYLHEPGSVLSGSKEPYQKFTPFYNACRSKKIESPMALRNVKFIKTTYNKRKISLDRATTAFTQKNPEILVRGGRAQAILSLTRAKKNMKHYTPTHNSLEKKTTELSAYIKFGCLSIREVQQAFKSNTNLVRQLIWRDFFAHILYFFPHVLGKAMRPNYNKIKWHHSAKLFHAWKTGTTGFPVVDAGMRQLNTTGYMHNRARLIVASFFVKTLLLDWRLGEKYFANQLTDYDPASNNGNWQWIMGGGADSQPYFRIFNPWQQSNNYDPHAIYIKTWIPELKDVDEKDIHQWDTEYVKYKAIHYPKPIVDYTKQKQIALKMYRDVFQ
jgi:deoxyribodipyrimidine photo-lyase